MQLFAVGLSLHSVLLRSVSCPKTSASCTYLTENRLDFLRAIRWTNSFYSSTTKKKWPQLSVESPFFVLSLFQKENVGKSLFKFLIHYDQSIHGFLFVVLARCKSMVANK